MKRVITITIILCACCLNAQVLEEESTIISTEESKPDPVEEARLERLERTQIAGSLGIRKVMNGFLATEILTPSQAVFNNILTQEIYCGPYDVGKSRPDTTESFRICRRSFNREGLATAVTFFQPSVERPGGILSRPLDHHVINWTRDTAVVEKSMVTSKNDKYFPFEQTSAIDNYLDNKYDPRSITTSTIHLNSGRVVREFYPRYDQRFPSDPETIIEREYDRKGVPVKEVSITTYMKDDVEKRDTATISLIKEGDVLVARIQEKGSSYILYN